MLAVIDENNCIGCTKCIQACPVDAIVGATRAMHTVMSDLCTGCNLCVDPCPTHCIELRPVNETPDSWKWDLNTIPVRIHSRGTTCLNYFPLSEKIKIWDFDGGIHPPEMKTQSNGTPLRQGAF
ncbi:ferredoxin-like protein, cytoplasmic membrane [Salmonella enterica subsp. enterica]|uniref:Ferredoxin-like protein, cytoplasmic membrane n=1 Tax=Salmonella enterica I TaxID=59201 RepID=A0A447U3N9_SALET|nr:ferredoxin-like protein, cytoplasmic membrane [Salmonella enterica subsp. enterica]